MKNQESSTDSTAIFALISTIRDQANSHITTLLAEQGITDILPAHGAVLHALFQRSPQSMSALALGIRRKKNTVTSLINTLESRGYCQRLPDPDDARVQLVALTEKGELLRPVQNTISEKLRDSAWQDIPEQERDSCVSTLAAILSNLSGTSI